MYEAETVNVVKKSVVKEEMGKEKDRNRGED